MSVNTPLFTKKQKSVSVIFGLHHILERLHHSSDKTILT